MMCNNQIDEEIYRFPATRKSESFYIHVWEKFDSLSG